MEQPLLITREQASHLLSIGLTRLDQEIAAGRIPTVAFGRAIRVPVAALERLVIEEQSKPE